MSLPVVDLVGHPYDQGLQHGRALRGRIAENLAIYFGRFADELGLARPEVLARATRYLAAIADQNADYAAALRGVANGSGFAPAEIAALNVRYELFYYEHGRIALAEGCTAGAVPPGRSASGHLLLGQNWDWIPGVRGAILRTAEPDGLATLSFTEAGIVGGKIGLNSAGLGLAINGLTTTEDDWARLSKPFHVRCYEILRARDVEAAARIGSEPPRACSTNFLIAQPPDRILDLEAAPDRVHRLVGDGACVVHANHFLDPAALGVIETPSEYRDRSCHRQERLRALLDARPKLSVDDLQNALRDHDGYPYSVCQHADPSELPHDRYATVASLILDLDARTLAVADGPPCETCFEEVRLVRPGIKRGGRLTRTERKASWEEAMRDPLFLEDLRQVEEDFRWADAETAREID